MKFILKTLWFVLPYGILFLLMTKLYPIQKGDLYRIGYIIDLFPSYGEYFRSEYEKPIRYTAISEKSKKKKFKILAIGDSFSEQPTFGYKNQLAQTLDVLYIDRFISIADNPVQTLYALAKGDFFDEYKVDYVVLQSAERAFVERVNDFDYNKTKSTADVFDKIKNHTPKEIPKYNFFSNQAFVFLYNTIQYFVNEDYCFEAVVQKTKLNRNDLFSINTDNLLFYQGDIKEMEFNNNLQKVEQLNAILNKLSLLLKEKGVQLIVLPAPDKYNMYYEYIEDKSKYVKPLFFEYLDKQNKEYIYIDSEKILKKAIERDNDIYFYDDTHWSPKATKIIAAEILKNIDYGLTAFDYRKF